MTEPVTPSSAPGLVAPVVLLRGVQFAYATPTGPLAVLKGVDLRVEPGECVAVMGPSGCGKTTLLNILAARTMVEAGSVTLLGRDPATLDAEECAALRRSIGMAEQDSPLIGSLSVWENVLIALGGVAPAPEIVARAERLLERLSLAARAQRYPRALSGGERQRVAIARARVEQPPLLLADEPTANQDTARGEVIVDLLLEHAQQGGAVVIATHNLAVAARVARAYRLEDGRLVPVAVRHAGAALAAQGAGRTVLQVHDLDEPARAGAATEAAMEAQDTVTPETRERPGLDRRARPGVATGLAWTAVALLLAVVGGLGGGRALHAYLAAHDRQEAAARYAHTLALEQQAALRDPAWPQFLHDPLHSAGVARATRLAGRRLWAHRLAGPVISSPVVSGGLVYVGGTDGYLHALDARTGRERWRFSTGAELVNSTPAVHGGLLYVNVSGNLLFALDSRTGRPRWSARLGAMPSAPPVVAGGLVLDAASSYILEAFDAASGRLRWLVHPPTMHLSGYPTEGAATVSDGVVYETFGAASSYVALRLRDGQLLWRFGPFGQRLAGTPAVDATTMYGEMWNGIVVALDRAHHTLRWWTQLPPTRGQGLDAAPVWVGDLLLAPDLDGSLYALSSATGRVRWSVATGGPLLASPALAGAVAYQPSSDGWLYAIDTRDGHVNWKLQIGETRSSPALAGGRLYVGSLGERALIAIG